MVSLLLAKVPWRRRNLAMIASLAAAGSGCSDTYTKPEAPNMASVVALYATPPDGNFDSVVAAKMLPPFEETHQWIVDLGAHKKLTEMLVEAVKLAQASETQGAVRSQNTQIAKQPLNLAANLSLIIKRICPGWTTPPQANESLNGFVRFTANFSETGPDSVTWADVSQCRYLNDQLQVELNAGNSSAHALRIYLGPQLDLVDLGKAPMIFDFNLRASADGESRALSAHFRTTPERPTPEFARPAGSGHVLVNVEEDLSVRVRAANGDFNCNLTTRTCTSAGGESFTY